MREKTMFYLSHISAIYGPIELRFGYDAPVGLCYHISRVHAPNTRFRGPWGPLK